MKRIILSLAAVLVGSVCFAQFSPGVQDPVGRWSTFRTPFYRMVYPRGLDSLAFRFAREAERWQPQAGVSAGMAPGGLQWGSTPVILHAFRPYSNGSVTWAPRRIDFYTCPEPYGSLPQPWEEQLVVHELRHHAQMQFPYRSWMKIPNYVLGEMWVGALSALFPNQPLLEGDAVVAETALTRSGRGRSPDFLNYYHVSMDSGERRDWYQWVYGSFRRETPSFYTAGYLTVAGMRLFYDQPAFTAGYFDSILRKPLPFRSLQRYITSISGKSFRETWQGILDRVHWIWLDEAEARGPFMPMEQITRTPRFATDYSGSVFIGGKYLAYKEGLSAPMRLVTLDPDGREKDLGAFGSASSTLYVDEAHQRVYWSETVPDARWTGGGTSRIRYMSTTDFRRRDLTRRGRLYNPNPSPDGTRLSVVEYPVEGGSNLLILSTLDGTQLERYPGPDGVQLTEAAWLDGAVYATGVAADGFGLWKLSDGVWTQLAAPSVQTIQNLDGVDDHLEFVSDRTGVNELYNFFPDSGKTLQLTSSRYGGNDYWIEDKWLVFCSQTPQGQMIFRTPTDSLRPVEVDLRSVHKDLIAEALSAQEKELLEKAGASSAGAGTSDFEQPKPYRKALHLVKFHSWAPIWFNYDELSSFSGDFSYQTASLGLTGLFQNDLGTAYGFLGYSAHPDSDTGTPWRHALHADFTYTGLYPVLQAKLDFNDESRVQYSFYDILDFGSESLGTGGNRIGGPLLSGSLSAYIPWNFSKGGHSRGVVPRISWAFSNHVFNPSRIQQDRTSGWEDLPGIARFTGIRESTPVLLQSLTASIRAYATAFRGPSQTYPRWGIGAEAGYSFRPGLNEVFTPGFYGYLYGYLPGFTQVQGLRWTVMTQGLLGDASRLGDPHVYIHPRGFSSSASRFMALYSRSQTKLTADYAIPVYIGDISIFSPVAYIKNLLVIPHADYTFTGGTWWTDWFGGSASRRFNNPWTSGSLWSVGVDLTVELANLAWFPFDSSLGVELDWRGGSLYPRLASAANLLSPFSAQLIFSIDL